VVEEAVEAGDADVGDGDGRDGHGAEGNEGFGGDGSVGGAGGDDGDGGTGWGGIEEVRGVEEGGAGGFVDEGGGEIDVKSLELILIGAGGQDGVVVGGEFFGDFADLDGGFAGAEDGFGMAAAEGAVVVEGGEGEVLERQTAEAGEGVGDGELAVGDVGEEVMELGRIHNWILAWGEGRKTEIKIRIRNRRGNRMK